MTEKGSNDLNLLLKAKVVKMKIQLDYEGSKIPTQIKAINTYLSTRPVKLKVKFDYTPKELNAQMALLKDKMPKTPLKLKVAIDVKGSADAIKKQLKEVTDVVTAFNAKYGQQIQKMQHQQQQANKVMSQNMKAPKIDSSGNVPTGTANVNGFNNIKDYVKQMKQAEQMMKSKFGKAGIFSSHEIKDAKGNLTGFIAKLQSANGVIESIRYSWSKDKGAFQVIDRATVTNTEKMVKQSMQSLRDLQRELGKTGKESKELTKEYNALMTAGKKGTLDSDMVKGFATKLKNVQAGIQATKSENDLLREQQKLIAQITRSRKGMKNPTSAGELTNLKNELKNMRSSDFKDPLTKNYLNDMRKQFQDVKQGYADQIKKEGDLALATKKRLNILGEIKTLQRTTSATHGTLGASNLESIKTDAKAIRTMQDYIKVKHRVDAVNREKKQQKITNDVAKELDRAKKAILDYTLALGKSAETAERRFEMLKNSAKGNLAQITSATHSFKKQLSELNTANKMTQQANSVVKGINHAEAKRLVDARDIGALKDYIGKLNGAKVATLSLITDSKGVSKISAQFESTGKTAKKLSYEIDSVNNKLKHMGSADVFNRNANLGIFEQLRIAMARVPVWMVAMTAFHGSIRAVSNMTGELLKIDKAVTNITRVASDNINVDTLIGNAVGLSAELGNNIHDILGAMEEFARTFGDFNERQLTDITKTAVLMSNVSDLTVEESTKSLVGTMNAFNITASESIRIVDSLNEVDNDYAISTKQLAEGLSKSASTAKTFGVSMEEAVGHITSIGSVTMESGAIIGNSLKTIYSRITTLNTSESILKGVNVEMYEMGESGKKVRPVADILSSLAGEWNGLTDEQRQNTAVSLAGRYQLSRFLAMMNNWGTATKATRTALSSQGSAMRENAKYMDSYESRINKLKNSFTEFSMSVGDSVLSAGMFTVITGLTSLAKGASDVVDKFGALPIVFGVLGILAFKMGIFNASIGTTKTMLVLMKAEFVRASAGARTFQGALAGLNGAMKATQVMIPSLIAGLKGIAFALKGLLASTLIGIAFVAIGVAVEKLMGKFEKAKRSQEKIKKANEALVDSYRNTAGGLEALIAKQAKLQFKVDSGAIKEGTDAYNEYVGITNQLAEKMPTVVKYIDQSGLAHLRENDAISKQFDIAKKLSELKAEETKNKFEEKLDERVKLITEQVKISEKLLKVQQALEEADGKEGKKWVKKGNGRNVTFEEETVKNVDNTDRIQAINMEAILSQQLMASEAQKTMKLIQDTTLAYMESDKQLVNMTDAGKKMVETTVQQNENLLMYSDKAGKNLIKDEEVMKKRAEALLETSKTIGEVVSKTYTDLSKGVEDPLQLEEINTNMDNVIKSLPDTFFKMESVDDADVITGKFKEILEVSKDIENGSADWDGLKEKVESVGFTSDEASLFVAQLGLEFKNSAIKAEAMTQATEGENVALQEMLGSIEAVVDATEDLFGYKNADLSAMSGHIANMERMIALNGKGIKSSDSYKESLQAVSQYLGIPEETIDKNLAYYRNMADLMSKVELTYDEATGAVTGFNKEGLNKPQIAMLNDMIKLGHKAGIETDALTGKFYRMGTDIEVVKDKQGKWKDVVVATGEEVDKVAGKSDVARLAFETMFVVLQNRDGSTSAFTNIIGDLSLVNGDVDKLKSAFENLQLGLGTPTGNAVLDGLIGKLAITDGTIDKTKGNIEVLKQILGIPANVNLLNDEQLSTTNANVNKVKDTIVKTREEIQLAKQENLFNEADSSANGAKAKLDGVKKSVVKTKEEIILAKQEKLFNEADASANGAKAKLDGVKKSVVKTREEIRLAKQERLFNEADDSANGVKKKVDEVTTSVKKFAEVKVPSGKFRGIYAEMEAGADANKGKLDILVTSIKKASDSAGILIALDTKIDGSTLKARGLKESLADALTGFSNLSGQSSTITNLVTNTNKLVTSSQNAGSSISSAYNAMRIAVLQAVDAMIRAYIRNASGLKAMIGMIKAGLKDMVSGFDSAKIKATNSVDKMSREMHRGFKDGMDKLVSTASGVPARIGKAIRDNMNQASSAMDDVAKDMVKRFKSELGIHSPSKVFTDLGGWVIKGLSNGLTGGNLKELGTKVFSDFGGEAFSTMDSIKDYMQFGAGDMGVGADFGNYTKTSGFGMRKHPITGEMSPHNGQDYAGANNSPIQAKAGGRVTASGASGSTFGNYVKVQNGQYEYIYAHLNKAFPPVGSTVKSGQMIGLMGSTGGSTGTHLHYEVRKNGKPINPRGFEEGGHITHEEIIRVGENDKQEMIIPLEQHRSRAIDLWSKAGQYLGMNTELIKSFTKRGKGGMSSMGGGSFGTSSGEGGEGSSGGDSGSSGVMVSNTLVGGYNLDGGYDFHALATKTKAVNPREGISQAFKFDYSDRQLGGIASTIALLEIKMGALNKSTIAYRDTLKSIIAYSNIELSVKQKVLITTNKRQATIKKELSKLPALSKQSTKQREAYNKLMEEYDGNLTKINSLKSEISSSILEIKEKSLEIFTDFIDEIVTKYDTAIQKIADKTDNIDFKLDVHALINEDDKKELLNLQGSKAKETKNAYATSTNKVNSLQGEYNKVAKSKGSKSKEALKVKEQLDIAKEAQEDAYLAVLQAEKAIKDTRASIADEGIKTLQDYHGKVKDMALEAIDLEKEALQEAHDAKMELYGEEEDAINSVYDAKLKGMDEEKDKASYQSTLDEKNAKKAELLNKIALLSRDKTLEGRKKVADLESELADVNKDITETQADRKDELLRKDLEAQKQAQLDAIALEKENAEKALQLSQEGLDATKDKITKNYDDLMNNDAYWAKMRDDAILGSFDALSKELVKMKVNLDNMNKGVFDGLYAGFSSLSAEVKRQVAELSEIDVDNMLGSSKEPMSDVGEAKKANKYTVTDGKNISGGTKVVTPNTTTPPPKKAKPKTSTPPKSSTSKTAKPKPSSNERKTTSALNMRKSPAYGNNVMTTLPKDAKVQYIGMEQGWAKIKYNGKTGFVGSKYLKKFDTGGYTGNWAGNEGKVAMLHKKEVVLNERQTKDILDSSKIMDKITSLIPNLKRNVIANELATGSMSIVNNYELHVNIERLTGDKKGAETVVTEVMKSLKKMGK